jgi:CheY-like chemotaxis protein
VFQWTAEPGRDNERRMKVSRGKMNEKRILIVEDEELVVDLIKGVLEQDNITIDNARDGEEALVKTGSGNYDLIVCDIKMPGMSGIAFYDKIKELKPRLAEKVIFITGDPSSETMDFINMTGNEYITKPFKVEKFRSCVYEFLNPDMTNS